MLLFFRDCNTTLEISTPEISQNEYSTEYCSDKERESNLSNKRCIQASKEPVWVRELKESLDKMEERGQKRHEDKMKLLQELNENEKKKKNIPSRKNC